jgi:thiol-disulfide isomerase/thioredoxin
MKRLAVAALAAVCVYAAQQTEQQALDAALEEAGSSPVEYLRAIEKHLQKYPDSPRRAELERAAVRAAIEAKDDRRIILYGERVLARQPDDLHILEAVTKCLLAAGSEDGSEKALKYASRSETIVRQLTGRYSEQEIDDAVGRALRWEARATGNLGRAREALALARRAFETDPTAESAREIARWYEALDKPEEAARALADAFTIPDPHTTNADRARDRGHMGELYRKAKNTDAGLGDMVLEAYDRNVALVHSRELRMRANDPNAQLTDPMEFTLSGLDSNSLKMATLKGKVVVFDFWATWCVPCREQHPLLERVKQRFRDNPDVVFLSIDTDSDRASVKPFLGEAKWAGPVYFEDGLSRALKVTSIPTTLVIDKHGRVFSRLDGFVPQRFVEMLTERIQDALQN